jgi:2-polyprenyl-3-methyl-5-hydroxy-6-metoxy-1,4-benzoquinol methylase
MGSIMEYIDTCNLCLGRDFKEKIVIKKNPYFKYLLPGEEKIDWKEVRIAVCQKCGLLFLNPRIPLKKVSSIYTDDYHLAHREDSKLDIYEGRLKYIRKYTRNGNLLDIGCGYGYFLKIASKYFDVLGLELSQDAVEFVRQNHKLQIINKDILKAEFDEQSFDVVTLWDVIEHLYDPYSNLVKINKILKKEGIVALRTGDISSLNAKLAGKHWFFYHLINHVYFFSKDTIIKMLDKAGFEVLEIYYEEKSFENLHKWTTGMGKSIIKISLLSINRLFNNRKLQKYLKTKGAPVVSMFADQMVVIARKR